MDADLVARRLAQLDDLGVDFLPRLGDDLLDPPRMNAPVADQLLEREPRDLAADRIEAGHDHGVRRVVDDDVDAGRELEGADVPALAADDSSLHLVVRQRHRRHRRLGGLLGRDPLNGERDDLLRLALGVPSGGLADLADLVGGLGVRLFFHPAHQLGLGVLGRHAGELLEPATFFAVQLLELFFAIGQRLLTAAEVAGALADFLVALLEQLDLPIEDRLLLDDPALLALDFLAAAADVQLGGLAKLDDFLFAGNHRALLEVLGFALGVGHDPLRELIGGRLGLALPAELAIPSRLATKKEKNRRADS